MTDTPGAVIRHHLMPFGCRLVIPPSFQTQIWIAFFCHSSSIDEADMPPNDDDFHSEAIPPATHGRGPFRRSSSFHETKLHPNDSHFHLVVNPSATKGRVSLVVPRQSTRPICLQMTVIFIWWSIHRRPREGVLVIPRGRYATE